MMKLFRIQLYILISALLVISCSRSDGVLEIYATTDLHGMLLPYDNTEGEATDHSLANLATLVAETGKDNILLLDNGDILQGDPLTYYYNFIDTTRKHIVADILDYLGYDAATAGNHDIETGHPVYDRVRLQYTFPLLAANAVRTEDGRPYFEPYTVIKRKGMKIVVFGLITPSVPTWLPGSLYSGITFEPMVATARQWMPEMLGEKPDLIVGLFHSGMGREDAPADDENSTLAVAVNVPGFDVIFCGHDHREDIKKIMNIAGDSVLVIDGGSRANTLMNATVTHTRKPDGTFSCDVDGRLIPMNSVAPSAEFIGRYKDVSEQVNRYTTEVIGQSETTVTTRDAFFGPSAFVDLIHTIQLDITGAQISLAAPLSFDQSISKGDLMVRDMFKLYRFENFLYTVDMTGGEIDRHLEHAAGLWFDTMEDRNDYMLKYRYDDNGKPIIVNGTARLRNPSYNFDSAMGISYTVDVTRPQGDMVTILSLSDGTPFSEMETYTVAVNSYRANGGGGHFPAAGITDGELDRRIINSTRRDMRFYMTEWIRERGTIDPKPLSDWKIIPEDWASAAKERETKLLFGNN
jgi:2',3'-cyclic-nucleotide 2'-phosphodiesterase/3'-nucleotidase